MKKLLYFGADWCASCKALWPVVEREAPEKGFEVKYCDMDTEEVVDMAEKFGVRSLPTLVVVDEDCNEIKRAVGNTAWKEVQE